MKAVGVRLGDVVLEKDVNGELRFAESSEPELGSYFVSMMSERRSWQTDERSKSKTK